ncbi:hypothetical protein D7D52_06575 [Nocardia yunnanensis]|uniref:Uncharacterized protein n=1 Tax=Nocardia yunnanensis TaxID=2382165 RepID=A0A386Z8Z6_9NOCA|nr:hypothetical protein [Nocardia yunnanensis]AYF73574.1 hypothetical protein D7D52_06575 [Nocardia yunnanensis]
MDRIDAVPEADSVEQSIPANPVDAVLDSESELIEVPSADSGFNADEGDLVEQSIPVPLDDEYDAAAEY